MVERIGNGMVKIGVTQEALEEGIDGLTQLKQVLQAVVSRQQDKKQAAIDYVGIVIIRIHLMERVRNVDIKSLKTEISFEK